MRGPRMPALLLLVALGLIWPRPRRGRSPSRPSRRPPRSTRTRRRAPRPARGAARLGAGGARDAMARTDARPRPPRAARAARPAHADPGPLAQHIFFHSLHQEAIPSHA